MIGVALVLIPYSSSSGLACSSWFPGWAFRLEPSACSSPCSTWWASGDGPPPRAPSLASPATGRCI